MLASPGQSPRLISQKPQPPAPATGRDGQSATSGAASQSLPHGLPAISDVVGALLAREEGEGRRGKQAGSIRIVGSGPNAVIIPHVESPPVVGAARKKQKVMLLDEDAYTAALEKIITRDFFPDLPKLQLRLEWLEATRKGDLDAIRRVQMKVAKRRAEKVARGGGGETATPGLTGVRYGATPGTGVTVPASVFRSNREETGLRGTPAVTMVVGGTGGEKGEVDPFEGIGLDEFARKYTSEDNASFAELLDRVNGQVRSKWEKLLEDERVAYERPAEGSQQSSDGFGSTGQDTSTLIMWPIKAKTLFMYDTSIMDELPRNDRERAILMKGPKKEISFRSTRFIRPPDDNGGGGGEVIGGPGAIAIGLGGGATPGVVWPLRKEPEPKHYDLAEMRKTPQVNASLGAGLGTGGGDARGDGGPGKYSLVATPSPAPGVDASPFMTWGDIEGTPLRLEMEDTPLDIGGNVDGPKFSLPPTPKRERMGMELARKASRNLHQRGASPLIHSPHTPGTANRSGQRGSCTGATPSTVGGSAKRGTPGGLPPLASKTPLSTAAQKLLSKTTGGKKPTEAGDSMLRASYSGKRSGAGGSGRRSEWDATPTPTPHR